MVGIQKLTEINHTTVELNTAVKIGGCFHLLKHQTSNNNILHVDYIEQEFADDGWSRFILDDSKGFTRAGVERINDSIRTYCWAIFGSQSQTRTDILGTGTAFDAQKQFLANIEDAINSPVDLPSQTARYQNTLKYARSKVDFGLCHPAVWNYELAPCKIIITRLS